VLASLALMAAPSWAAKGGNSANAKLCEAGGYPGVLLNGHGESFKNEGQCTKAGAKGELAGVNAVAGPAVGFGGGTFRFFPASYSGFGLKPGTRACPGAIYGRVRTCFPEVVNSDGTFSFSATLPCELEPESGKVGSVVVDGTTAAGTLFARKFPPPSGC
jgi:hypothetical protein